MFKSALTTLLIAAILVPAHAQLRDPTRPPEAAIVSSLAAPPPIVRLELSSVMVTPWARRAVINGQRVGEGDAVDGIAIKEITREQVVVRHRGQTHTLRLRQPIELVTGADR